MVATADAANTATQWSRRGHGALGWMNVGITHSSTRESDPQLPRGSGADIVLWLYVAMQGDSSTEIIELKQGGEACSASIHRNRHDHAGAVGPIEIAEVSK